MLKKLGFVFMCLMLLLSAAVPVGLAEGETDVTLYVRGNKIVDGQGNIVRLYGVNCPSLEWTPRGDQMPEAVIEAFDNWDCNLVRLPMSQDFWFGHHSSQNDGGAEYRRLIDEIVNIARERNKYIWLDLHWSNAGTEWGKYTGQHKMPDENSLTFWLSVAEAYKNHPNVLFGLYNEPHSVSWAVWRNGGKVQETVTADGGLKRMSISYNAVGMQTLIDAIRGIGANNIVIVGGLDWGFDLSRVTDPDYELVDTAEGNGIVYDTHPYPWKNKNWSNIIDKTGAKHPVIVGEFGIEADASDPTKPDDSQFKNYYETLINWLEEHQYSFTAWSFHPSAGPSIIKNWQYEPTPYHGAFVKDLLVRVSAKGVSLFDGKAYTGNMINVNPGEYSEADLKQAGMEPSAIRSVKLSNDPNLPYRITFYAEDNLAGKSYSFISDLDDLGKTLGGFTVKSLKIENITLENIGKGARVECSHSAKEGGAVTDGDEETKWIIDEEGEKWVKADLGSVFTISRIIIKHAADSGFSANHNNQDFKVSVSADGEAWTEVYSVTGNTGYKTVINFEPALARYIRVDVTKGSRKIPGTRVTLSELEVYGMKDKRAEDFMKGSGQGILNSYLGWIIAAAALLALIGAGLVLAVKGKSIKAKN
ncbi:MAG TPA: cellulase family glycosylhydrolase [Candidatus Atribacteria bacterium]|nr:cellulase family glycosylhydrolase [Candidatus Atribacteria bacterium]HPT78604.1 cellulase family glycosylhydrolase [Candidatus Atribacteria bacterium]